MAVGRAMSLKEFRGYVAKLRKSLNGVDGAIVRGIHSGAMRSIGELQKATREAFPASPNGQEGAVDTGAFLRSWQFELLPTGGRVFNNAPYAGVIEHGRRPGRKPPPSKVLVGWIQRRMGLSKEEAEAAAFPIARAIGKRGLAGRKILTSPRMVDTITRIVMEEVRAEVRAALAKASQ